MNLDSLKAVLETFMPWQHEDTFSAWRQSLPPTSRSVVSTLETALADPTDQRHVLVIGLRRVGKTVAMQQTIARLLEQGVSPDRLLWLRLDHPLLRTVNLGELVQAMVAHRRDAILFLDEVTAAADWDTWLKSFFDDQLPTRIVATSSATSTLRTARRESGAGRWREIELPPWLTHEAALWPGKVVGNLHQALLTEPPPLEALRSDWGWDNAAQFVSIFGGFPEVWPTSGDTKDFPAGVLRAQDRLRSDIVQNAIYRDLALHIGIEHPDKLEQLLTLLAAQVAQIITPTTLASSLGMSQPTVDRYLSHLEAIHLVFRLYNYSPNEETKLRRGRKVFLADNAVRNAVLGRLPWTLPDGEKGHLLENQAAVHLHAYARQTSQRLYYWRDGKSEVDFILPHPTYPIAVEVGSSEGHTRAGLLTLQKKHPLFLGRTWLTWPEAPWAPPKGEQPGTCSLGWLLAASGSIALQWP